MSKFALVRSTTFAWHTQSPARTKKKADVWNIFTKTDNKAVSSLSTTVRKKGWQTTANTVSAFSRISTRSREWWRVVETAHGGGPCCDVYLLWEILILIAILFKAHFKRNSIWLVKDLPVDKMPKRSADRSVQSTKSPIEVGLTTRNFYYDGLLRLLFHIPTSSLFTAITCFFLQG